MSSLELAGTYVLTFSHEDEEKEKKRKEKKSKLWNESSTKSLHKVQRRDISLDVFITHRRRGEGGASPQRLQSRQELCICIVHN